MKKYHYYIDKLFETVINRRVKTNDTKEVTGVLVVCEGGDDKNLVAYITDAINGLLGVPVHKIKVMKMSE